MASGDAGALHAVRVFWRHVVALRLLVLPLLATGIMLGLPSTLMPELQSDTFGAHKFLDAGLLGACKGVVSLVVAPLLGVVSDRHGRKRTLFGTCCCLSIPPLIMGFSHNFWAFCVLDIFFGAYSGALSVLLAAIADVIPGPTNEAGQPAPSGSGFHAHGFSVGMAAFGFGVGLGSAIGTAVGVTTAFRLSAVLGMTTALYVMLLFPEVFLPSAALAAASGIPTAVSTPAPTSPTYHQHSDSTAGGTSSNRFGPPSAVASATPGSKAAFNGSSHSTVAAGHESGGTDDDGDEARLINDQQPVQQRQQQPSLYTPTSGGPGGFGAAASANLGTLARVGNELREDFSRIITATSSNRYLRLCFLVVLLDSMAEQMMVNLALLYLQEQLGFTDSDQLALIIVLGISGVLCLLVVIPLLSKTLGTISTLQLSLVANAISIGMYAFVTAKWEAIVLPLLCLLGAGVFPCTSAVAAATVSSKQEGLAQGVTAGARMLAEGASPAILGVLFYAFKHTVLPGAPFLFAAAFVLGALLLSKGLKVRPDGSIMTSNDLNFYGHDE